MRMITGKADADQEFRVVVSAIVGGPFGLDVVEGTILRRSELGEWEDSLVRRGAIVVLEADDPLNLKPASV